MVLPSEPASLGEVEDVLQRLAFSLASIHLLFFLLLGVESNPTTHETLTPGIITQGTHTTDHPHLLMEHLYMRRLHHQAWQLVHQRQPTDKPPLTRETLTIVTHTMTPE